MKRFALIALFLSFSFLISAGRPVQSEDKKPQKKGSVYEVQDKKVAEIRFETAIRKRITARSKIEKEKQASALPEGPPPTIDQVWNQLEGSVR
jgi:hypothetical protein